MSTFDAWVYSVDPLWWIAGLIILSLGFLGYQLNRIERQNEGLYNKLRNIENRMGIDPRKGYD